MRDTGIAGRLRAAGLVVVEVAGWQTRGSETFDPRGSVDHHTAGPRAGNAPSLGICINGRSDLPGPLCHVLIGRDNTCYVIAAGRAHHAGQGGWRGLSGNSSVYGIERENVGTVAEPWRRDQTHTAAIAHAALLRGPGLDAAMVCEHKEWAPTRKPDAHTVDGDTMRALVRSFLSTPVRLPERLPVTSPPVDIAITPSGQGYGVLLADGGVFAYGDCPADLSTYGAEAPGVRATGLTLTPDGRGCAVVYENGKVHTRNLRHVGEPASS